MSAEKTEALVIRLADFSESSRVVTLFTKDFGKISCLAKGAKRLRSAFEVSLDLLSQCQIVFLQKSSGTLDLLTESKLVKRFQPSPGSLSHLYAGYYLAELLSALTEEGDPHPELYQQAVRTLAALELSISVAEPVSRFELSVLREIGQIPDFESCTICQSEISSGESARFWVSQSGLICSKCGHSEYQTAEFHPESLQIIRQLANDEENDTFSAEWNPRQKKEIRQLLGSAITHTLGKRPKTLSLLKF